VVSLVPGPASAARVSPRPVWRAAGVHTGPATVRDVHCRRCQHRRATRYADDIHVYSRCRPNDSTSLCHDLGGCIEHVASWMGTNRLQLNAAKTEFIWFVPPRRRHQFPSDQLAVGFVQVTPAASVQDLGVYLDSNMSMRSHVTRLVCTSFGILRQIRSIRRSVPRSTLSTRISSFVMSKLD